MGPLLLEKGPDGYTALEHVQRRLEDANRTSSKVIQGIYSMIKGRIELQIDVLNELDAKQRKLSDPQG